MSNVLAIASETALDRDLVADVAARFPSRVTVLILSSGFAADRWAAGDGPRERAIRDRLAGLLAEVEDLTGAEVAGLVGDTAQVEHLRFDDVVRATPLPIAA
jgi:hypothetical protein